MKEFNQVGKRSTNHPNFEQLTQSQWVCLDLLVIIKGPQAPTSGMGGQGSNTRAFKHHLQWRHRRYLHAASSQEAGYYGSQLMYVSNPK